MANVKQEWILRQTCWSNSCSNKEIFQTWCHCEGQSNTDLIHKKSSDSEKIKVMLFFFFFVNIHDDTLLCLKDKRNRKNLFTETSIGFT